MQPPHSVVAGGVAHGATGPRVAPARAVSNEARLAGASSPDDFSYFFLLIFSFDFFFFCNILFCFKNVSENVPKTIIRSILLAPKNNLEKCFGTFFVLEILNFVREHLLEHCSHFSDFFVP